MPISLIYLWYSTCKFQNHLQICISKNINGKVEEISSSVTIGLKSQAINRYILMNYNIIYLFSFSLKKILSKKISEASKESTQKLLCSLLRARSKLLMRKKGMTRKNHWNSPLWRFDFSSVAWVFAVMLEYKLPVCNIAKQKEDKIIILYITEEKKQKKKNK